MHEELKARLLAWTKTSSSFGLDSIGKDISNALKTIEQLERQLAERDAEIAKYRDAPVVAWVTTESKDGKQKLDMGTAATNIEYVNQHKAWKWLPLIVKPGE